MFRGHGAAGCTSLAVFPFPNLPTLRSHAQKRDTMPRFELSRLRSRKDSADGDRGDQASKTWQALLGPFSHRPAEPARRPAKPRAKVRAQ